MAGSFDEQIETPETAENSDYQAFLDDYSSQFASGGGETYRGHVLSVTDQEVIVDIGRKIEGLVPASQFPVENGVPAVKRGDVIEVMVDRTGPSVKDTFFFPTKKLTGARSGSTWNRRPRKERH